MFLTRCVILRELLHQFSGFSLLKVWHQSTLSNIVGLYSECCQKLCEQCLDWIANIKIFFFLLNPCVCALWILAKQIGQCIVCFTVQTTYSFGGMVKFAIEEFLEVKICTPHKTLHLNILSLGMFLYTKRKWCQIWMLWMVHRFDNIFPCQICWSSASNSKRLLHWEWKIEKGVKVRECKVLKDNPYEAL